MFRNSNILITGASSGIGMALARELSSHGASLVLVARREERLRALANELSGGSGRVTVIAADVTTPDACERIASQAPGDIDGLINNAGMGQYGPVAEQDIGALESMMQLNMTALLRMTKRFLPGMIERRRGHIVNIASVAGLVPTPYMTLYGATKAFVVSFSNGLWEEVRKSGVAVTCVCPGPVQTEFFERGGYTARKNQFTGISFQAENLAKMVCRRLERRPAVYVPGLLNKLCGVLPRFTPRTLATRISGKVIGPPRD